MTYVSKPCLGSCHPNLRLSYHLSFHHLNFSHPCRMKIISTGFMKYPPIAAPQEHTVKYMHFSLLDLHRKYYLIYSSHWNPKLETPNRWDQWRRRNHSLPRSVLEWAGADICQGPQTGDRQQSRRLWNMYEKRMLCLKKKGKKMDREIDTVTNQWFDSLLHWTYFISSHIPLAVSPEM